MEKKEKRKPRLYLVTLLLAIICVLSLCCSIVILLIYRGDSTKTVETVAPAGTTYTQEELDLMVEEARQTAAYDAKEALKAELKEAYTSGDGVINELRALYPDDIVYYDRDHYAFVPINPSIPLHSYEDSGLKTNELGEMEYYENNEIASIKGIDVSKYQGEIDWKKVSASGVKYAILRVGLRGYGSGALVLDDTFERNIKGALANGIEVGVYFFTQAISEDEAREEAQFVLEAISPYKITYPVVIDVEVLYDDSARTYNLTADQRTDYTIAFCEEIRNAGYTPMIYGNLKTFCGMLQMERLNDYEKWFAFYDTYIYFPYEISMWQYTDTAVIDGIDGPVDLNITFPKKERGCKKTPLRNEVNTL